MTSERLSDSDWLREQYVHRRRPLIDIAAECGCALETVRRAVIRAGIPRRVGGRPWPARPAVLADPGWLRAQYVTAGRTIADIAREVGCSDKVVTTALDEAGIPRRPVAGPTAAYGRLGDAEWLREQHHDRRRPLTDIAAEIGCSSNLVAIYAHRHGIPVRKSGGRRRTRLPQLEDHDWLREQYEKRGRSLLDIAEELGCTPRVVVPLRPGSGTHHSAGASAPTMTPRQPCGQAGTARVRPASSRPGIGSCR